MFSSEKIEKYCRNLKIAERDETAECTLLREYKLLKELLDLLLLNTHKDEELIEQIRKDMELIKSTFEDLKIHVEEFE